MRGFFILPALAISLGVSAQRSDTALKQWEFSRDMSDWKSVSVPHDWAIYGSRLTGPTTFKKVTVEQNGEKTAARKTGRTGGLPYIGKGITEPHSRFRIQPDRCFPLNSTEPCPIPVSRSTWKRDRSLGVWLQFLLYKCSRRCDCAGEKQYIEVSLENKEKSSRWYPGAGLYRNVRLVTTSPVHVPTTGAHM